MRPFYISIAFFFFINITFTQNKEVNSYNSIPDAAKYLKKELFPKYVSNIIPAYLFFGPYSFMYGVSLGATSIVNGDSPFIANTKWLATPVIAGLLINLATKESRRAILNQDVKDDLSDAFYYNMYFIAPDISSIKDVKFVSTNGQWNANILEVNSSFDFPAFGFRTGFFNKKYGIDYEMSISEHHTPKQDVYFQYNTSLGGIQDNVELPSHFYMLHHMFMGLNLYFTLPKIIVTPYAGIGGGILLNSVQSEYPGPADLVRKEGSLALDAMEINLGYHGFLGFRFIRNNSFYYLELRPTLHSFDIESGTSDNRSNDTFNLESFQVQIGIGQSLFK